MAGTRRHTASDIARGLALADQLMVAGTPQREIARTLGISVMTLHRWRKLSLKSAAEQRFGAVPHASLSDGTPTRLLSELEIENSCLRRILGDLLLENLKRKESLHARSRQLDDPAQWR